MMIMMMRYGGAKNDVPDEVYETRYRRTADGVGRL